MSDEYNIHFQSTRTLYIRISLYSSELKKLDEIQGVVLSGNIDMQYDSPIRKSCSISLAVKDSSFLIGEDRKIWVNKIININIGIKNILLDEIVWFNKGFYYIDSPNLKYNSKTKELSFKGLDQMCNLNGTLRGKLETKIIIDAGTNISTAIKVTAQTLGKINKLNIEEINQVTPYKIEKEATGTIYSVLEELKELYMNFELFFDDNGYLVFRKIKNRIYDSIQYDFSKINKDLITDYSISYDFQNVKNRIVVYGQLRDNTSQIKSVLDNTNINSPFNIDKLGVIPYTIEENTLFTQEQADARAGYEIWKCSSLAEKVDIECLPIYNLNCNNLVYFNLPEIGLEGRYQVSSINCPLGLGLMNFSAFRVYPES